MKEPSFQTEPGPIGLALLQWFAQNRRSLPFREDPTPYHVWVSEIMLQQTRMTAAVPYYLRFVGRLPDIAALAECDPDDLNKLWEGLGYYSRVRNLQKAAQQVCREYGGKLPADYEKLRALPGIGEYTAGAIASIGFGLPAAAVDGNVLRVFARLYQDESDIALPETKKRCTGRVLAQQPPYAPGDFNQALMELGALVCVPGKPDCASCPLQKQCLSAGTADAERLPVKAPRPPRTVRPVTVALVESEGRFLLSQRPAGGLLAGLWQPLLWEEALTEEQLTQRLNEMGLRLRAAAEPLPAATHKFTHVEWQMQGLWCPVEPCAAPMGFVWAEREEIEARYALPGALKSFKKQMLTGLSRPAPRRTKKTAQPL